MNATSFLQRLHEPGICLFGTWVKLETLETLELLAHAGFDFVVIDMEHAPHTFKSAYRLTVAAQGMGLGVLVRLPDLQNNDVQRLLDSGADGLLVPRVQSADAARRVLDTMIFSPKGSRGLGITSRAGRWGLDSVAAYVDRGNSQIVRALQLEDAGALAAAADMVAVEGVNAIFVGLGDLSLTTGLSATHPDIDAMVTHLLKVAADARVPCGTAVGDAAAARRAKERGFSFVMVSNDCSLFGRAAADLMKAVRA